MAWVSRARSDLPRRLPAQHRGRSAVLRPGRAWPAACTTSSTAPARSWAEPATRRCADCHTALRHRQRRHHERAGRAADARGLTDERPQIRSRCPSRRRCPQPFWHGLAEHRIVVQYSPSLDRYVFYPRTSPREPWPTTWSGAKSTAPERCTPSPSLAGPPARRGPTRCRSSSRWCSGTPDHGSAPNWSTSTRATSGSECGSGRCSAIGRSRGHPAEYRPA